MRLETVMKLSFVVMLLVLLSAGGAERGKRKYCGRVLSDALAFLCPKMEEIGKRSRVPYMHYGWQWPMSVSGARGKRGIVDECCYNSCSLDVLLSYC